MSDVYASVSAVMDEVQAVAKKDRNQHQNFNFRGVDAVVNAVGPALRKHKVIVVPTVDRCDYDDVQTSTGKPATACRVEVTYTFYAADGSSLPTSVVGEAWDAGDKATPKAMSVAFRTALLQALSLPTDEADPDAQTYERAPRQKPKPSPKPDTANKVQAALTKAGVPLTALTAYVKAEHGVDRFMRLDPSMQESILTGLTRGVLMDDLKAKYVEKEQAS
jgi:hypothetical protein